MLKIIFVFSIPLYSHKFLGYTIVSLLMEFNTVFLHLRFMFVFHSVDKSCLFYRIVSTVNIGELLKRIFFFVFCLFWSLWFSSYICYISCNYGMLDGTLDSSKPTSYKQHDSVQYWVVWFGFDFTDKYGIIAKACAIRFSVGKYWQAKRIDNNQPRKPKAKIIFSKLCTWFFQIFWIHFFNHHTVMCGTQ